MLLRIAWHEAVIPEELDLMSNFLSIIPEFYNLDS